MNNVRTALQGIGLGASLMYLFDPVRGKLRRGRLRDRLIHTFRSSERYLEKVGRDMGNRWHGMQGRYQSIRRESQAEPAPDRVLVERVRAKMGRYVSHPGAIDVLCQEGKVTLRGPILTHEVKPLMTALRTVRGVDELVNQLDEYDHADHISSLQGGIGRRGEQFELLQDSWSPAARLVAAVAGTGLMLNCLARRTPGAVLLGTFGFGLFLRGITNVNTKRMIGLPRAARGIEFRKIVLVGAPVERVYQFLTDVKRFSRFLVHVRDVRDLGNGRHRWTVAGPAGIDVHLEDQTTEAVPNQLLAWESVPESTVPYQAAVHLTREAENRTRMDVRMSYNPPGGIITHAVASLFGWDPKSEMNRDLLRIKTYLETGRLPHDVARRFEIGEP